MVDKLNKIYKIRKLILRADMTIYLTVVDLTGTNLTALI
jgi:hypothetical protein